MTVLPDLRHRRIAVVGRRGGQDTVGALLDQTQIDSASVEVGQGMFASIAAYDPDVVVVDHGERSFDVVRVCRDLSETVSSPIIVLSAESREADHIGVLDAGADDCLPHGVSPGVFLARIRLALRRSGERHRGRSRRATMSVGPLHIDLDAHAVTFDGEPVALAPREFRLLAGLAEQAGRVVPREQLVDIVWGDDADARDPSRLRVAISLLRRELDRVGCPPVIETVSHVGYRLAPLAG